jgi:hypothetical protein
MLQVHSVAPREESHTTKGQSRKSAEKQHRSPAGAATSIGDLTSQQSRTFVWQCRRPASPSQSSTRKMSAPGAEEVPAVAGAGAGASVDAPVEKKLTAKEVSIASFPQVEAEAFEAASIHRRPDSRH